MKMFLRILGGAILIASIVISIYLGVYLMLFGGIVQIITSINPLNAAGIAFGILRIVFCEMAVIVFVIGYVIGLFVLKVSNYFK